ncbi:MAG: zinc metallopeptidase [Lachnospiraceae bacterium]|nr:zinc metallopeptidase [Lachnospiraceae bacterium]
MLLYSGYNYGYGYDRFLGEDPVTFALFIVLMVVTVISLIASSSVKSTFRKYQKMASRSGMTGADCAAAMLRYAGISDVTVRQVPGELTDHYDPRSREVCLSESVYGSTSVAALGVAAHECGHALQHEEGYVPLSIRTAILPVANIGSKLGYPLVVIGLIISQFDFLIDVGIGLFAAAVFFQLVTLPVEFDASARAVKLTQQYNILLPEEKPYCIKVLKAAGMTYLASAAIAVVQLLRLMSIKGRRR